jgi:hypothetical protein
MVRRLLTYICVVFVAQASLAGTHIPSNQISRHILGRTDLTYLQQGFDSSGIPPGWTTHQIAGPLAAWSVVGTGTNPPVPPYSGDGQAKFNSYDAGSGEQARLTSPSVNLVSATDPFLIFYMYHEDEFMTAFDSVYVEISTVDSITGPWTVISGIRRPRPSNGWSAEVTSLFTFRGTDRVFVSFRGVSKYGNNIFIDEVSITDTSFHDIGATALWKLPDSLSPAFNGHPENLPRYGAKRTRQESKPAAVFFPPGSPVDFEVEVRNFGSFSEPSFQVEWRVDAEGQTPVTNQSPLARNEQDTLSLRWNTPLAGPHVITAWTSLAADSNYLNDTIRAVAYVLDSTTVFFEGFDTTGQTFPPPGWVTINRDGGLLSPWFQGLATSPFLPYAGAGFAADNFQRANGQYIDDYLITPRIPGIGQAGTIDSLIFWARSVFNPPPNPNYPDSLMIMVSTTGTDTSDFTTVLDYFEVSKSGWTRHQYLLTGLVPQNADIYVAFRYLHYSGGPPGPNSDFVGLDAIQVTHHTVTSQSFEVHIPTSQALFQNYPNPFNASTRVVYRVRTRGPVRLTVYDALGREVVALVDEEKPAGTHEVSFDAGGLSSGVYFLRLSIPDHVRTHKLVLLQ